MRGCLVGCAAWLVTLVAMLLAAPFPWYVTLGLWLFLGPMLMGCLMWFDYRLGDRPWQRVRAAFGWGMGVKELARRLDLSVIELQSFVPHYTERRIPKRRGGTRLLHVPDGDTKHLQRRILRRLLARLQAHQAAHAYEKGRSIATNAAVHQDSALVIKLDIVEFFPSTTPQRVERYFRQVGWNRGAAQLLARLTTHAGGLPQGAPTSPRLANLVNVGLDHAIGRAVGWFKGRYTRYADDLTLSFPEDWPSKERGLVTRVNRIVKAHGYQLHGKAKTRFLRRHQRQAICGLVVNAGVKLPRQKRRWLRAVRHRQATGGQTTLSPEQLAGWDAYEHMVDAATDG